MNTNSLKGINPETITVGEIVAQNYNAAGVLKQHGLDFCCGGGKTLQEACKKKNLDPGQILRELNDILEEPAASGMDFSRWSPDHLIDHIESTHHRFVRRKIVEISTFAQKVAHVHGRTYPENVEIYDRFRELASELTEHLESEEESVFPAIRSVFEKRMTGQPVETELTDNLRSLLTSMEDEHETAGSVMAEIRTLSNDYIPPEDACTTYRILYKNLEDFEEDLHKHVHLENNILFKKAEQLL